MSYRTYIQPLTEKSDHAAVDGELLVNTENGHISVYSATDDTYYSATKDIYSEVQLQNFLIKAIGSMINDILTKLAALEPEVMKTRTAAQALQTVINEIRDNLAEIGRIQNQTKIQAEQTMQTLWLIYTQLGDYISTLFSTDLKVLYEVELLNAEYEYFINFHKKLFESHTENYDMLKEHYAEVKKLLASKVDKATYDAWVKSYVNRVTALPNVTFRHITP